MQPGDGANHAGKRAGNADPGDVGEVGLAVQREAVNAGRKGGLDLGHGAAEGDKRTAIGDPGDGEPLAGEPGRHLGQVCAAEAELGSVLLRRQPLVVARRCGVLLVGEQLVDRGLLRGAGREA